MQDTNENKVEEVSSEHGFKVVIPKRRTWFYSFVYAIRGSKFFEAILGPQVKALPAPVKFRN